MSDLFRLSATKAARAIARGELTSEALVTSCLERIEAREGTVRAWAYVAAEQALAEARERDRSAASGPLHGVPVGIKDVIDTADMPTDYGSDAFDGFQPREDAECVRLLKEAGAIILGKTVTAEFATYRPGPTRNPHNPDHTPGGSSSGSAAAVADFHVPLTLGTQTAGSVIRPASFCGVIGFKPTRKRYDTGGMVDTAHHLDTLGGFGRAVEDLELLDSVLGSETKDIEPTSEPPRIGLYRSGAWNQASPETQKLFFETADVLRDAGAELMGVEGSELFDRLGEAQRLIHMREAWICLGPVVEKHADRISDVLKQFIAAGRDLPAEKYLEALDIQKVCVNEQDSLFGECDFLLTPSAPGIAPYGIDSTGDPVFNRMWTALGTPCLGFPVKEGEKGLPIGLQIIGRQGQDREILGFGHWMVNVAGRWQSKL